MPLQQGPLIQSVEQGQLQFDGTRSGSRTESIADGWLVFGVNEWSQQAEPIGNGRDRAWLDSTELVPLD